MRLIVSAIVVAVAAFSFGAAIAWLSDTGAIRHEISAAPHFDRAHDKVWVCKIIGPPHDQRVDDGKNPIRVSIASVEAQQGFSGAHPSYVVADGDEPCRVPGTEDPQSGVEEDPEQSQTTDGEQEETAGQVVESDDEPDNAPGAPTDGEDDPGDPDTETEPPAGETPTP